MPKPFRFLLLLQGGLLLLGGGGMLLGGFPMLGRHPFAESLLGLGLLLGLAGLEALFRRLFPHSFHEAERLHRELGLALRQAGATPPFLLLLAFLSGLAEEVFFRGFLQSLLALKLGPWAVLLQAFLFALLHPAPRGALAYTLYTGAAGLLLGLAYLLTGSLLPGVLAHFLHNARGFYELGR
ncbi:CPBP family glutamic-type intramembrane protease [Thermus sp.]|uniref:CPBP family glutamic-type intramembrane protease n=1 Tax=Thermus sp. TaxID=275 RepID=UPI00321F97AC